MKHCKKIFFIFLLFAVVGWTGSIFASGEKEKAGTAGGAKPETVTIRVMTRWSGVDSATEWQQSIINEFMEKNPNVKILDESINEIGAYTSKFKADVATGTVPHIFMVGNWQELAKNGIVLDLTPVIEDDKDWSDGFIDGIFEEGTASDLEGKYLLPVEVNYEVFYYNTELFEKAGIEGTPDTFSELMDVIRKLKAIDVVPLGMGAKDAWRPGHLHNAIFYKTCGVDKAKAIAAREAKWTDSDVVRSFEYLMKFKEAGAFSKNFEGIDYNSEKANFFAEKSAMTFNGMWFNGEVAESPIADKVSTFLFPMIEEFPQYAGDNILYTGGIQLSGKAKDAEKEAMIEFAKFFTSKYAQERFATEVMRGPARKDIEIDISDLSPLFIEMLEYAPQIKNPGKDTFAYDALGSMADRTRNSIAGLLLGNSPAYAADEIQKEIDRNTK